MSESSLELIDLSSIELKALFSVRGLLLNPIRIECQSGPFSKSKLASQ